MHEFLCHSVQLFQCMISEELIHLYQLYEQEYFVAIVNQVQCVSH